MQPLARQRPPAARRHALLLVLLLCELLPGGWGWNSAQTGGVKTPSLGTHQAERQYVPTALVNLVVNNADHDEMGRTDAEEALFKEAMRVYAQNQPVEAIALAQRVASLSRTVSHLYFLGQAHRKLGSTDLAFQYFHEAFDITASLNGALPLDQEYWLHFQYAELLRQSITSNAVFEQRLVNELKRQAIHHYECALSTDYRMNERVKYVSNTTNLVASNRIHVLNTIGMLLMDLHDVRVSIPFFERAAAADPTAVQPLGNLALALMNLGETEAALHVNEQALELDPNQSYVLHNAGNILHLLGREDEAIVYWERAHQINPNEPETLNGIATHYGLRGHMNKALQFLQRAFILAEATLAANPSQLEAIAAYNRAQLRLASSRLPLVYQSADEIVEARFQYASSLQSLLSESKAPLILPEPITTVSMGSMGYYAVYQGFNDVGIRSQLARVYRKGIPALSFTAPHVVHGRNKTYQFTFPPSATTRMNRKARRIAKRFAKYSNDTVHVHRRIRVGFHSGYMRYHSVGLLMQGVITHLPRDAFEVIVIIYDDNQRDELTELVLNSADNVVFLSHQLHEARLQIADLELDVLVFTEIGMDLQTYFLAFSRLALRTAMFWGHAVTSGIDTVDYFVSSKLFYDVQAEPLSANSHAGANEQQSKYTECVFEMGHLTTYFLPPLIPQEQATPTSDTLLRESLGLPPKGVLPVMILIPQTLYKFHPDFDRLIERVLSSSSGTSFLAVPIGAMSWLGDDIRRRWRRTLSPSVYRRIYFLRPLSTADFLGVCAMADLVLDPFPVGGGRSSFEIFAVGTPIVILAPRTTILQLTAAMYNVMGITDLITYFEDDFVEITVRLARDKGFRTHFRQRILENKHKLFENAVVIREWETFLISILAAKSPPERTSNEVGENARMTIECPHVLPSAPVNEPFFDVVVYVNVLGGVNSEGTEVAFTITMPSREDDPFEISEEFAERFHPPLDSLRQNIVAKIMWNAKHRQSQSVVRTVNFSIGGSTSLPVEIRYGDDLHLALEIHLKKQPKLTLDAASQDAAMNELKRLTPEHTSPAWIAARSFPFRPSETQTSSGNELRDCVTLLITTCKRLSLFLRTITSLQHALGIKQESDWSNWFCYVLIVDDNSSPADRDAMKAHLPTSVEFFFKTPDQRGHAKSLNLAIERIQSQFVLYLEDDWEFQNISKDDREHAPSLSFLSDALAILRSSRHSEKDEPLALVLLSHQNSGWERRLDSHGSNNHSVRYFVHEFAVCDPAHTFSYWPGFSLNPGVWDLHAIFQALDRGLEHHPPKPIFDENSDIFERDVSIRIWRSGLRIAYLSEDTVVHIGAPPGTNASAYVLNGMPRTWDLPSVAPILVEP